MRSIIIILLALFSSFTLAKSPLIPRQVCEDYDAHVALARNPGKLLPRNASEQLSSLTFKFEIVGISSIGREVEVVDEVPVVALPVSNGWLLGSNRGEWGGKLVFKNKSGNDIELARDNIEDIYKFNHGYIVTAGLAHMGMSEGSIYLVTEKGNSFSAIKLHGLTGAPKSSWLLENGELLVNTWDKASSILSTDGELRRVQCTNLKND